MPVCFFDDDYNRKYNCEYEIVDNFIEVTVDYDIGDEIEGINGVKVFGNNTEYAERDVLIVDYENKKNFLLKKAYYTGHTNVYGSPDGGSKTKFQTQVYFLHRDFNKLVELKENPKVKKIKIYSPIINDCIGFPSLTTRDNAEEYIISLNKNKTPMNVEINSNYIKNIAVDDTWTSTRSSKNSNVVIDLGGYIELELTKKINYEDVSSFINELAIYLQLYKPDKFYINKIQVLVDEIYYELVIPYIEGKYKQKPVKNSVDISLLEFLRTCYTKIPYRKSKTEIRNIPYIVLNGSKHIEENFLMFYRFIECYYKKQSIQNISKKFVSYSIDKHYTKRFSLSEEEIEKYSQEIICLRNHYVHSGYYFKNSTLRISFDRINRRKNPKDYVVNNVDIEWIYDRTKVLYYVAIDIIFSNMLGHDEYEYGKKY